MSTWDRKSFFTKVFFAWVTVALIVLTSAHADVLSLGIGGSAGLGLFPELVIYPRHAGKPDPRWRAFHWRFTEEDVDTARYRLYFYDSEKWAAQFVAPLIEEQILDLKTKFNYSPTQRFDYMLFTSLQDFRQANVFDISEGVQGITSTTDTTMAIPYNGDRKLFMHVSKHELTHQFQVQKANDVGAAQSNIGLVPLWFIEGMAEYYSLDGLDSETYSFLRDLQLHENKKEKYVLPGLFEDGPMSFIMVYKVGQTKIAFFENAFGVGSAQKLFTEAIKQKEVPSQEDYFRDTAVKLFATPAVKLDEMWRTFAKETLLDSAAALTQTSDRFSVVPNSNDNLDAFKISPSGRFIVIREIDEIKGTARLVLLDSENGYKRTTVAVDSKSDLVSLYFMQAPSFAVTNEKIIYAVQTVRGPEIEYRQVANTNPLRLGKPLRLDLSPINILQAQSLTLSSDGRLAFVGLRVNGWPAIYTVNLNDTTPVFSRLTDDYFSYEDLSWAPSRDGTPSDTLLLSSNRTARAQKNLFSLNVKTHVLSPIAASAGDQLAPSGDGDDFVFQSWQSGSSQIHRIKEGRETRLTAVKTLLSRPENVGGTLYALGFSGGRYKLFMVPEKEWLSLPVMPVSASQRSSGEQAWQPILTDIPADKTHTYKPFRTSGVRVDDLGGFLNTGGQLGLTFQLSDLMRNYGMYGEIISPNNIRYATANLTLVSKQGKSSWSLSAYRSVLPRLDTTFGIDQRRTFLYRESGVAGSWQYPLGAFSYFEVGTRAGYVDRFGYSDPSYEENWHGQTAPEDLIFTPTARIGYDSILYELFSGPIEGWSLLLESQTSYYPYHGHIDQRLRLDGSYYLPIKGRTILGLETLIATTRARVTGDAFLLSGDTILRAYVFGDDRLLGRSVAATKAEVWFPVGSLFLFDPLRAVVAYDIGTIALSNDHLDEGLTSSGSVGFALNLPPLGINFIWSWPFQTARGPEIHSPVLHFSLRYLYF